jgi:hypothetical protein
MRRSETEETKSEDLNSEYEGKIKRRAEELNQEDNYQDFLDISMRKIMRDGFLYTDYDLRNLAQNLVFGMQQHIKPNDLKRDYEIECVKLKESYTLLINSIDKIKKNTSETILTGSKNDFISLIDIFLNNILDTTDTLNIISDVPINYKSILDVCICHDIITNMYDVINDEVLMLGDTNHAV